MPAFLSDIKRYKQLNIKYTKLKQSCQGVDLPGEPWLEKRGLVTSYWAPGTVWETEEVAGIWVLDLGKRGAQQSMGSQEWRMSYSRRGQRDKRRGFGRDRLETVTKSRKKSESHQ